MKKTGLIKIEIIKGYLTKGNDLQHESLLLGMELKIIMDAFDEAYNDGLISEEK